MSIELNEEQVDFIEKRLEELGLTYTPLQGEMLDHICCLTEAEMQNGVSFEAATQTIFEIFGKDELKKLQEQTISSTQKKSLRMKNLVLTFFALLIIPSSVFFFSHKEKTNTTEAIQPPTPQEMMSIANHLSEESETEIASADFHDPPSIKPLAGDFKVNSGFGKRMHPIYKKKVFHKGIDLKAPTGTPVLATSDGVVEKAENWKKHGLYILIQHDDEFKTKYSHLSELKVKAGQKIKKGDVIGLVGNTGESTAPHLHYEVIKNGEAVDPMKYFNP